MATEEENKNSHLYLEYLRMKGKEPKDPTQPRTVGRPVRLSRPENSAEKRTLPGEQRYAITMKKVIINKMKSLAKKKNVQIKDIFEAAALNYINQKSQE